MRAPRSDVQNTSRLKSQAAFDSLRKTKLRWVAKGFAVQAIPAGEESNTGKTGFCVIASKKTAKKSVDRNRLRRRLRAIAQEILPRQARPDHLYMIVARHDLDSRTAEDLRRDMVWCLRKMDLVRDKAEGS